MSELILTGIQETDDFTIIRHAQDISGVINANIETQKHTDEIWDRKKNILPAATLDMATFLELQKHGIMQDKDLFFRWLERNPQYKVVNKTFARNIQHF